MATDKKEDKKKGFSIEMAKLLIQSNWIPLEDESGKGYILFLPNTS